MSPGSCNGILEKLELMKRLIINGLSITFLLLCIFTNIQAQNLEVEGKAKITEMELKNDADSVVVVLPDGTLARRDVSTLAEFQILSISNDTVFLSNGGFVKLPVDLVDDTDADPSNEIQNLSEVLTESNDADSFAIINLADPTNAQDAVTKAYIDQMAEILLNAGLNGVVMDIDGNTYKTIKIGTQVWMAENLKTTRYNDGSAIPLVTDNTAWENLNTPAYSWYGNDSTLNAKLYGALYNYYTVAVADTTNNVCPTGWHVPTDTAWGVLTIFLSNNGYGYGGSGSDIGKSMASTFGWTSSGTAGNIGNDQATNNSSGFAGLPGGYRNYNGTFEDIGNYGYWWCSSEDESDPNYAWHHYLNYSSEGVTSNPDYKEYGYSVRCLRD